MTEAQHQGQVEGWREDPYGRHDLRFFDGHRWTPYVRDGEKNGLDEPGGPIGEGTTFRSLLLDEDVLVVERFTDLGRRWSDRSVLRTDGTKAGMLRRAAPAIARTPPGLKSIVVRDHAKNDVVELVDDKQMVVQTLIRPIGVSKSSVEVRDSEGRDAGRIVQQTLRRNETTFAFLGPNGHFLGDLQSDNWVAWDLRIMDSHARQVATITRDWTGLDLTKFTSPDDYVVRISHTVHGPLRALVVACALSVEGARAAGAVSVSVLTGGCTREELLDAGTDVVLESLEEFPAWLDEHLLVTRLDALARDLEERGSVMVAYSGGADSAFLLAAAVRALGPDRVVAATGYSHSLPEAERDPARDFAATLGVELLTPETHEMEREGYRANGGDRCFFCKAELIDVLTPLAEARGITTVATGTNADDAVAGFRPGIRAADERGAVAPLRDAGLTKAQVREASHRWGLPTWDKPAAACLSSRVAYGVEVTPHRLARVERAEAAVRELLAPYDLANLRVRDLGDRASVEVDRALLPLAGHLHEELVRSVARAGFDEVVVDELGFRSGSLNERLA